MPHRRGSELLLTIATGRSCAFGTADALPPSIRVTESKRENLRFLFWPRSLAIIGASAREGTVGRELFANVLMNG
ncbi:MAG: hypothetical protein ABIK62_04805, partial [candidate division WOR-3 bacterium]